MRISETVKARRKELNLTQEQVADYLGVTAPAVHKWEKGSSFPDISLLPALARLLKMDMNTLFSFETELTEQEISLFANEVIDTIQKEGYQRGYELVEGKIRQFPGCAPLLYSMASLLEGALALFGEERREQYEGQIERWYEQAAESGEGNVKDQANYVLIRKLIGRKEYKAAEDMLGRLPDQPVIPSQKTQLQVSLLTSQGRCREALPILEKKIWDDANGVYSTLGMLLDCFFKIGEDDRARFIVCKMKEMAEALGLWEYCIYLADYEMAVHDKDKEQALEALRRMLKTFYSAYGLTDSLLYAEIFSGEQKSNVPSLMRNSLVKGLKKENGLDGKGFLKDDPDLEALLKEFGK